MKTSLVLVCALATGHSPLARAESADASERSALCRTEQGDCVWPAACQADRAECELPPAAETASAPASPWLGEGPPEPPEPPDPALAALFDAPPADAPGPIGGLESDEVLAHGARPALPHAPHLSEMTRHIGRWYDDFWCNAADGSSLGMVRRAYWRQFVRQRYVYTDRDGQLGADAWQPFFSPGLLYKKQQQLLVANAQGKKVAHVKGLFWTWAAVKFVIYGPDRARLADVWIDRRNQSIVYTRPKQPRVRLAAMLREQQAGQGYDRWRVVNECPELLDVASWAVINAFFANYAESTDDAVRP